MGVGDWLQTDYEAWKQLGIPNSTVPAMKGANLKIGSSVTADFLHLTGGLRAAKASGGWNVGPVLRGDQVGHIGPVPDTDVMRCCASLGVRVFGGDHVTDADSALPTRIWTPILWPPVLKHQAADTWSMIASGARSAGDDSYAFLAQNVSLTLHAADIRLRDASDQYHLQLIAALKRSQQLGRFQNIPAKDLHLAFHSVLTELASTRDYLATIAARQIGAPAKIDALSRLDDWLQRPPNRGHAASSLIAAMLEAYDETKPDPWLWELTDYRNFFLHTKPLGTDEHAQWLSLTERETPLGKIRLVEMQMPIKRHEPATCEALNRFVDLHARVCRLADFAAGHAKHAPYVPQVRFDAPQARIATA
jgi:hypothetical protein